jgi:hypothetical protein
VAIPQGRDEEDGVDSLNVAAAAAILLWAAADGSGGGKGRFYRGKQLWAVKGLAITDFEPNWLTSFRTVRRRCSPCLTS